MANAKLRGARPSGSARGWQSCAVARRISSIATDCRIRGSVDYFWRFAGVMLRAPKSFQDRTLWPEYQALSLELDAHLEELTTRVIREAIDDDVSEAAESTESKALPGSSVE